MNQRLFKTNVILVIVIYAAAILTGAILKANYPDKDAPPYEAFKDLVPLIIAIPAAWLGYCFQRRQAYLKDVRELWTTLVIAYEKSLQYTHLQNPSQIEYGDTLYTISCAIEELRAVFINIGESGDTAGLFPFESIKCIHRKISTLGFGNNFKQNNPKAIRDQINEIWKNLRRHFLNNLQRGLPETADSPYLVG
jgi:hypothetical protein